MDSHISTIKSRKGRVASRGTEMSVNYLKKLTRILTFRANALRSDETEGPSLATSKFCLYFSVAFLLQLSLAWFTYSQYHNNNTESTAYI